MRRFLKLRYFRFNADRVSYYMADPHEKSIIVCIGVKRLIKVPYPSIGARDDALQILDREAGLTNET